MGGGILARWTSDFDCKEETEWWYVIKDAPFCISDLKAKRRYEITKGNNNFYVKSIDPKEYREELYRVTLEAYSAYPKSYRPTIDHDKFVSSIDNWDIYYTFAAFSKEDNTVCGYALLRDFEGHVEFNVLKTKPSCEKKSINAAIVNFILEYFEFELLHGKYICDGERSVLHETAFQNYLEKYFGFRKAYCKLHIKYRFGIGFIVRCLYPVRGLIAKGNNKLMKQISSVLRMEEIARSFR